MLPYWSWAINLRLHCVKILNPIPKVFQEEVFTFSLAFNIDEKCNHWLIPIVVMAQAGQLTCKAAPDKREEIRCATVCTRRTPSSTLVDRFIIEIIIWW